MAGSTVEKKGEEWEEARVDALFTGDRKGAEEKTLGGAT